MAKGNLLVINYNLNSTSSPQIIIHRILSASNEDQDEKTEEIEQGKFFLSEWIIQVNDKGCYQHRKSGRDGRQLGFETQDDQNRTNKFCESQP